MICVMNWKGHEKKRSWTILRYCPSVYLEEMRETRKGSVRIFGLQSAFEPRTSRIRSRELKASEMNQDEAWMRVLYSGFFLCVVSRNFKGEGSYSSGTPRSSSINKCWPQTYSHSPSAVQYENMGPTSTMLKD